MISPIQTGHIGGAFSVAHIVDAVRQNTAAKSR
jgi:hypothetical protein